MDDPTDLMRRLVKEQILKFDGTPLFPERRAYSPTYQLSDAEAGLYKDVTDCVREQFSRTSDRSGSLRSFDATGPARCEGSLLRALHDGDPYYELADAKRCDDLREA
jgi:hypothetical protein